MKDGSKARPAMLPPTTRELGDGIKDLAARRGMDVSVVVDAALDQYLHRAPIEDQWWEEMIRPDEASNEQENAPRPPMTRSKRAPSIKKAISLPEHVLAAVDDLARRRHRSRSAIILAAVDAYLERIDAEDFAQSLNDAYGDETFDPAEAGFLTRAARDLARIIDEEDGPWPTD